VWRYPDGASDVTGVGEWQALLNNHQFFPLFFMRGKVATPASLINSNRHLVLAHDSLVVPIIEELYGTDNVAVFA